MEVVPVEQAIARYRAAVDMKNELDPDFVIMSQCYARDAANSSLADCIKRLQAYCGAAFYAANWPGICGGGSTLLAGRYATITAAQFATFPTLEVFLSGLATPIQLAPFDYLVPVSAHTTVGQTGYYYLGVRSLESRASVVYLGDVFMRNRIVMFDNVNNRVGFAAATSACGR